MMKPGNVLAFGIALCGCNTAFGQSVAHAGLSAERNADWPRRVASVWEQPVLDITMWSGGTRASGVPSAPSFFAIAREGQPMPAGEAGTLGFMLINPATLDASGRGAFVADVDGAERNQGIFFADANSLKVIAMGCGETGGYGSTSDCGDPSPIGGTFSGMFRGTAPAPAANDDGDVLFIADLVGAPVPRALFLYRSQDESIIKIAAIGDPSPRGGTLTAVGPGVINNAGTIAFTASTVGNGSQGAEILVWRNGLTTTYVAAGDPAPNGEVFSLLGAEAVGCEDGTWIPIAVPALNDDDQIAFKARTQSGDGLYLSRDGVHERLVRWDDPEPGGGVFFDFGGHPVLNDRGEIAFLAYIASTPGGPATGGGWFVGTGGTFRRALMFEDGLSGGEVSGLAYSRNPFRPLDNAGNLVLWARYRMADESERESIVVVDPAGTPAVLVEEGAPTTIGGTWGTLNAWPTSNDAFQVQFQAGTPGFFASTHGQFVATYRADLVFADGFEFPSPE